MFHDLILSVSTPTPDIFQTLNIPAYRSHYSVYSATIRPLHTYHAHAAQTHQRTSLPLVSAYPSTPNTSRSNLPACTSTPFLPNTPLYSTLLYSTPIPLPVPQHRPHPRRLRSCHSPIPSNGVPQTHSTHSTYCVRRIYAARHIRCALLSGVGLRVKVALGCDRDRGTCSVLIGDSTPLQCSEVK